MADVDCSQHKGHKRYVGGLWDGNVAHLIHSDPSGYSAFESTELRNGTRSWYELDYDASEGTEAVYRYVGDGRGYPTKTTNDG